METAKSSSTALICEFDLDGVLWVTATSQPRQRLSDWNKTATDAERAAALVKVDTVWVPTEQVYLTRQFVPGKRQQDWQQALPFALEEQLAEPVESVHIIALDRDDEGVVSAAVVSKTVLQNWIETLESNGLGQVSLVADCFRLAEPEASQTENTDETEPTIEWCCFQADGQDRYLVRQGQWLGFAGPKAVYETALLLANQTSTVSCQQGTILSSACELTSARSSRQACQRLNLRQNGFLPKNQSQALLKRWQLPLVLLLIMVVALMFNLYQEAKFAQQQAAIYQAQTEALFKKRFPEVKRLINIRTQTKNQLAKTTDSSSELGRPMETLLQVETVLKSFNKVRVTAVDWHHKKRLSLTLQAPQLELLQGLINQLQQNLRVELKMNQVSATQVEGVIYVDAN